MIYMQGSFPGLWEEEQLHSLIHIIHIIHIIHNIHIYIVDTTQIKHTISINQKYHHASFYLYFFLPFFLPNFVVSNW